MPGAIAGDNDGAETEASSTFHHFTHTTDMDNLFFDLEPV
jgi:hypothetical protein